MSSSVDQRVVEMRFDNQQFEHGVSTSLGTLDKLKAALKFKSTADSLMGVNKTASTFDFSSLLSATDVVSNRLSTLGIIGVTALQRITNAAIDTGKKMLSALTIDPIKTGFQEYETQMNAVQTILANTQSKGRTLDDVNRSLADLNTYADKTIYNFTEMTKNIGRFTAAGMDLEPATSAIKGIANLAAVSGSTSQQASTAMYQLSQALASGTVNLQDWNSVVNAGMGGQIFQDALKRTAKHMGKVILGFDIDTIEIRKSVQDSALRAEFEEANLYNLRMSSNLVKGTHSFGADNFFTPLTGNIIQDYDPDNGHYGIDIAAPENQVIKAVLDGTVIFASWTYDFGYTLGIQHENNYFSAYKHNAVLLKKEGDFVKAGEVIAILGKSGETISEPQLHFELWHNGMSLNPVKYINFEHPE